MLKENESRIYIPSQLNAENSFNFLSAMHNYREIRTLIFDFSYLNFAYPEGIVILASEIKDFVNTRKSDGLENIAENINMGNSAISYLSHIGFLKYLGIEIGNPIGTANGNTNYFPLKVIDQSLFIKNSIFEYTELEKYSSELASIILNNNRTSPNHPVAYCFTELIRNVFEHAQTDKCLLCAQKYSDKLIKLAIIDRGCGILSSLSTKYSLSDNHEALVKAIQPGVSKSNTENSDADDYWANSGFGLYVLSSLSMKTGHFLLCSGSSSIYGDHNGIKKMPFSLPGTVLCLEITKPHGENMKNILKNIVKEGEQRTNNGLSIPRASRSSKKFLD